MAVSVAYMGLLTWPLSRWERLQVLGSITRRDNGEI